MLYIRVDGNAKIGTGHVMRCLSIADAAKKNMVDTTFILADEQMQSFINDRGYRFLILHSDYTNMDEELLELEKIISQESISGILCDSYQVTKSYLKRLSSLVKTACIDDMMKIDYPVDLLINYNIYGEESYYRTHSPNQKKRLLGCQYAPIRAEFVKVTYQVKAIAKDILITTGGGDQYDITGEILRTFSERKEFHQFVFHVVCGAFNSNRESLHELERQYPKNIQIHENVTDMATLMKMCDMAISAGGTTMYELAAVGVPTICFYFVDNQEKIAMYFEKTTGIPNAGDFLLHPEMVINTIVSKVENIALDYNQRSKISTEMRKLVDGKGADRIAAELIDYFGIGGCL